MYLLINNIRLCLNVSYRFLCRNNHTTGNGYYNTRDFSSHVYSVSVESPSNHNLLLMTRKGVRTHLLKRRFLEGNQESERDRYRLGRDESV